jgi:cytoskeletal protein CcmA (bactofilin family)
MRRAAVWMVVALGAGGPAAAAPPTDVRAYAAFGIDRVTIGAKARVTGDVGCLFEELSLGQGTRVTGAAAAPTIRLRRHARVTGDVFCAALVGTSDSCQPLPNPFIDGPTIVLAQPGVLDVSTPPRATADAPLPAGAYGRLTLGAASHLTLAGGGYQFESIELKSRARLVCAAACEVTVRGAVVLGQATRLGAADGVAAPVVLRIAASGTSTALDARSRAIVGATVYAPNGDVRLGASTRLTGGLVGHRVTIGPRARVQGPAAG